MEQAVRESLRRLFRKKTKGKESSKKTKIPPKKVFSLAMKVARPITKNLAKNRSGGDNTSDAGVDSTAAAGGTPSNDLGWMAGGIVGYTGGDSTGNAGAGVGDTNGGYTSGGYGGLGDGYRLESSGGGDYGGGGYSGGGETGGGYSGGGDSGGYSGGGDSGGASGPSGGTDW